jgi:putative cell wall-binding protein
MVSASALVAGLLVGSASTASAATGAMVDAAACTASSLPPNDDGSSGAVDIGFDLDFFGATYTQLYVNNNGNVTFDSPLSTFTPFQLATTARKIIAPFFADVDTRGTGSGLTRYGYGTTVFEGRPAFCVTWKDVGYYASETDKLNSFQLLLVDRSDLADGAFDIVMNYDKVQWETGSASDGLGGLGGNSARVGYSNGATQSFELPGSGTNGAFLDSNSVTGLVHGSRGSTVAGRYVFAVRGGTADTGHQISGAVTNVSAAPAAAVQGAYVSACATTGANVGACALTTTSNAGRYALGGLVDGVYRVSVSPPGDLSSASTAVTMAGADVNDQNFELTGPVAPPAGTSITPTSSAPGEVPTVFWTDDLTLRTQACPGGTGSYSVTGTGISAAGALTEGPAGTYTATIPAFFPNHGDAHVTTTVTCPGGGGPETTAFDLYIDPSGTVVDTSDTPIAGATVTLLRSNVASGPFTAVPDGDAIMSPGNRTNPDTTSATGAYGWDVIPGYYVVRAQMAGCHAPGNAGQPYVDSAVLPIPPEVTDLKLTLECGTSGGGGNPPGSAAPTVDRIAGPDRYATSAAISKASFAPGVARAYVATGDSFPDALSGAAVAGAQKSPVLLVRQGSIPAAVITELARLNPKAIVVLGGTSAVSTAVEQALDVFTDGSVTREAGVDRYETAATLSKDTFTGPVDNVFVATGSSFPDALSGAAAAGAQGVPVLLVQKGSVPAATLAELTRLAPKKITVLGGAAAVSDAVVTALKAITPTVERWSGADRYATSVAVSSKAFSTATRVLVATGEQFADALAGAAVAAGAPGPMLLSTPGCVPASVAAEIARLGATSVTLLGGTSALGAGVASLKACTT